MLLASYRSRLALAGRGVFAALAGLTKFAPLALAPLLATHAPAEEPLARRIRSLALYAAAFVAALALASIPAFSHDSLHEIYERTFAYQSNRGSPFSVWGLYGLPGPELVVEVAAVLLALVLALIPRRPDTVGLAAACAAVVIAEQLSIEHWFYLYIPWFFGLVIVALFGSLSDSPDPAPVAASAPARWSLRAAAVSS